MAPMIDIMFLLLIFFMTSTIMARWETKIGITVPSADSGVRTTRQRGEIIINLDKAGTIIINDANMSEERLERVLKQIAETFPEQPVIIRADAKTNHEDVVTVLDICKKVDIWNISFAALEKEGSSE